LSSFHKASVPSQKREYTFLPFPVNRCPAGLGLFLSRVAAILARSFSPSRVSFLRDFVPLYQKALYVTAETRLFFHRSRPRPPPFGREFFPRQSSLFFSRTLFPLPGRGLFLIQRTDAAFFFTYHWTNWGYCFFPPPLISPPPILDSLLFPSPATCCGFLPGGERNALRFSSKAL